MIDYTNTHTHTHTHTQVAMIWACAAEDDDRVKKCTEYEDEGARPRGRPKKTWRMCKKTVSHVN